jgi:hypothetical protein
MKTPIQEVYDNFNLMSDADFKAWMLNTDLLKKEKDLFCQFAKIYDDDLSRGVMRKVQDAFDETFRNNESAM